MKRISFLTLMLAMALPIMALAQGSGTAPPPSINRGMIDAPTTSPFAVTRTVTGKVAELNAEKHLVVIEDDKTGKRIEFKVDSKTKYAADKHTEFTGKKNILLSDFEIGRPVKITILASNGAVTEVRLRHVKK